MGESTARTDTHEGDHLCSNDSIRFASWACMAMCPGEAVGYTTSARAWTERQASKARVDVNKGDKSGKARKGTTSEDETST